jgi:hypothetical protein
MDCSGHDGWEHGSFEKSAASGIAYSNHFDGAVRIGDFKI